MTHKETPSTMALVPSGVKEEIMGLRGGHEEHIISEVMDEKVISSKLLANTEHPSSQESPDGACEPVEDTNEDDKSRSGGIPIVLEVSETRREIENEVSDANQRSVVMPEELSDRAQEDAQSLVGSSLRKATPSTGKLSGRSQSGQDLSTEEFQIKLVVSAGETLEARQVLHYPEQKIMDTDDDNDDKLDRNKSHVELTKEISDSHSGAEMVRAEDVTQEPRHLESTEDSGIEAPEVSGLVTPMQSPLLPIAEPLSSAPPQVLESLGHRRQQPQITPPSPPPPSLTALMIMRREDGHEGHSSSISTESDLATSSAASISQTSSSTMAGAIAPAPMTGPTTTAAMTHQSTSRIRSRREHQSLNRARSSSWASLDGSTGSATSDKHNRSVSPGSSVRRRKGRERKQQGYHARYAPAGKITASGDSLDDTRRKGVTSSAGIALNKGSHDSINGRPQTTQASPDENNHSRINLGQNPEERSRDITDNDHKHTIPQGYRAASASNGMQRPMQDLPNSHSYTSRNRERKAPQDDFDLDTSERKIYEDEDEDFDNDRALSVNDNYGRVRDFHDLDHKSAMSDPIVGRISPKSRKQQQGVRDSRVLYQGRNHREHPHLKRDQEGPEPYFQRQPLPPQAPPLSRSSRVKFSVLEIRSYERILGDNPSCSSGPSVGIGWRYDVESFTMGVDRYERGRMPYRLEGPDIILSREEREELLADMGYNRGQIADAVRANVRSKNQRRQTINNLPAMRVEELVQTLVRRIKRRLGGRKGKSSDLYHSWKYHTEKGHIKHPTERTLKSALRKRTNP